MLQRHVSEQTSQTLAIEGAFFVCLGATTGEGESIAQCEIFHDIKSDTNSATNIQNVLSGIWNMTIL